MCKRTLRVKPLISVRLVCLDIVTIVITVTKQQWTHNTERMHTSSPILLSLT